MARYVSVRGKRRGLASERGGQSDGWAMNGRQGGQDLETRPITPDSMVRCECAVRASGQRKTGPGAVGDGHGPDQCNFYGSPIAAVCYVRTKQASRQRDPR